MSSILPIRARALERAVSTALQSRACRNRSTTAATVGPAASLARCLNGNGSGRSFSTTRRVESRLGKTPLNVPPEVKVTVGEPWVEKDLTSFAEKKKKTVTVEGPLGTVQYDVPAFVHLDHDEKEGKAVVSVEEPESVEQRAMWGTTRAFLNRHITGVSEGHTTVIRLVGIGYRASIEARPNMEKYPGQKFLSLKLGFTHPIELGVPLGVTVNTPSPTRILIEGTNYETCKSFAGQIRQWRKPEPYKGKGIFVNDETIKLKQKKIK